MKVISTTDEAAQTKRRHTESKPPEYKRVFFGKKIFREYKLADGHSFLVPEHAIEQIGSNTIIKSGIITHYDFKLEAIRLSFPRPYLLRNEYFCLEVRAGMGIRKGGRGDYFPEPKQGDSDV